MTEAKYSGTENAEERRESIERRHNGERRNKERLAHMRGEYRSNVPRRKTDVAGRLVEGELWWTGT